MTRSEFLRAYTKQMTEGLEDGNVPGKGTCLTESQRREHPSGQTAPAADGHKK